MAMLIKTDGQIEKVAPANGKDFTLEEMQKLVGGLVEVVKTISGKYALINEEGKVNGLPINLKATAITVLSLNDFICGDMVICNAGELK